MDGDDLQTILQSGDGMMEARKLQFILTVVVRGHARFLGFL
jgi:hypothetical protein